VARIPWELLVAQRPEDESQLRSLSSEHQTAVVFDNRTGTDYSMFWLNFQGKREPHGTLYAGHKLGQNTFATHPWVVVDPEGKVVGIYVPGKLPAKVVLK
jgi:hypothetical protein